MREEILTSIKGMLRPGEEGEITRWESLSLDISEEYFLLQSKAGSLFLKAQLYPQKQGSWLKEESHLDIERDCPCDGESRNL